MLQTHREVEKDGSPALAWACHFPPAFLAFLILGPLSTRKAFSSLAFVQQRVEGGMRTRNKEGQGSAQ